MLTWFRLVRLPNLLMIALTQFLVRYCIIMPAYLTQFKMTKVFPEHLSRIEFLFIVFATVIIAAGGYVINDVFDVYTDEINKPSKNVIGKKISERTARTISSSFFIIGSIIGIAVAVKKQLLMMGLIFPFSAASLYMYASFYKRRLLIGNLMIALLSALTVFIIGIFEQYYFVKISIWLRGTEEMVWTSGWEIILFYVALAFMVSFIREVIKDAEDIEGDERTQCKTFPVRFGMKKTKILAALLILITTGLISFFIYKYFYHNTLISFWSLLSLFIIPFGALFYLVVSANEKKDYSYASLFAKLVMLYGILTIVPFYYYFLR